MKMGNMGKSTSRITAQKVGERFNRYYDFVRPYPPRVVAEAIANYRFARENGDEVDNPERPFPTLSDFRFLTSAADGDFVETKPPQTRIYFATYDSDRRDGVLDWMEEKDLRYLLRLQRENPELFSAEMKDLKAKNEKLYENIKLATDSQWVVMKFIEIQQQPERMTLSVVVEMLQKATNLTAFKFAFTMAVAARERKLGDSTTLNKAVFDALTYLAQNYLQGKTVEGIEGSAQVATMEMVFTSAEAKGFITEHQQRTLKNLAQEEKTFADSRFQFLRATVDALEKQVKTNAANIGKLADAIKGMQTAMQKRSKHAAMFGMARVGLSLMTAGVFDIFTGLIDFSDIDDMAVTLVRVNNLDPAASKGVTPDNFESKLDRKTATELARAGLSTAQFVQLWRDMRALKAPSPSAAGRRASAAHPSPIGGGAPSSARAAAGGAGGGALTEADILDKIDEALEKLNTYKSQTTGRKQLGVLRRINELDTIGKKLDAETTLSYEERTTATQHIQFAEGLEESPSAIPEKHLLTRSARSRR